MMHANSPCYLSESMLLPVSRQEMAQHTRSERGYYFRYALVLLRAALSASTWTQSRTHSDVAVGTSSVVQVASNLYPSSIHIVRHTFIYGLFVSTTTPLTPVRMGSGARQQPMPLNLSRPASQCYSPAWPQTRSIRRQTRRPA